MFHIIKRPVRPELGGTCVGHSCLHGTAETKEVPEAPPQDAKQRLQGAGGTTKIGVQLGLQRQQYHTITIAKVHIIAKYYIGSTAYPLHLVYQPLHWTVGRGGLKVVCRSLGSFRASCYRPGEKLV